MTVVPFKRPAPDGAALETHSAPRDPAGSPQGSRIAPTKTFFSAAGCPEGGGAEPGGKVTAPPRVRFRQSYERAAEAIGELMITLARLALDALVSAARAVHQRLRGRA